MSSKKLTNQKLFGDLFRDILSYREITQYAFAKKLGKSRSYINQIVTNKYGEPKYSSVEEFEKALNVEIRKTKEGWEAYDHSYNPNTDPREDKELTALKEYTHTHLKPKETPNPDLIEAMEAVKDYELSVNELQTSADITQPLQKDTHLQLVRSAVELLQAYIKSVESVDLKK